MALLWPGQIPGPLDHARLGGYVLVTLFRPGSAAFETYDGAVHLG